MPKNTLLAFGITILFLGVAVQSGISTGELFVARITNKEVTIDNLPPNRPIIDGHVVGRPGTYKYTFNATDPNEDNVSYYIDWNDGTIENWTDWYLSGKEATIEHTYSFWGTYVIKALAKDIYGLEGPAGTLAIRIQRNNQMINPLFLQFLEQFPFLERLFQILPYISF